MIENIDDDLRASSVNDIRIDASSKMSIRNEATNSVTLEP